MILLLGILLLVTVRYLGDVVKVRNSGDVLLLWILLLVTVRYLGDIATMVSKMPCIRFTKQ